MRAVIIANGRLNNNSHFFSGIREDDLLIAADGGAHHFSDLELIPDVVIGDMDSISPHLMDKLQTRGVEMVVYPTDKDQTDLELALGFALQHRVSEIILFGVLGGRLDLSLANILLLAREEWKTVSITVMDGPEEAFLLRSNDTISIKGRPGDILSLIPLSEFVDGVTTEGLRWKLENASLLQGNTRSVSNEFLSKSVQVKIKNGKMLLVHRRSSTMEDME